MFNSIIGEIYEKRLVRSILENMRVSSNDIDDLEQEIYMILLNYNKEKIIQMWEKKQLNYFVVGVITRQYNSKTSPFYKKYKKYYKYIDGNFVNNEDISEDNYNYEFED